MELYKYMGKRIKLISVSGHSYEGIVDTYISALDNEPEPESIVLNNLVREDGYKYSHLVEFTTPEIKSIEVIEKT